MLLDSSRCSGERAHRCDALSVAQAFLKRAAFRLGRRALEYLAGQARIDSDELAAHRLQVAGKLLHFVDAAVRSERASKSPLAMRRAAF